MSPIRIVSHLLFVSNDGPKPRWLEITKLLDKTGNGHAESVLYAIAKRGFDTDMIAFQSYDYASTMSGKHNGAQAMLSEKLGYEVPYVPCQGHRSNTVMEHSSAASSIVTSMYEILEALYVFFFQQHKASFCSYSSITKRLLRNLSKTRLSARAESIRTV